MSHFACVYPPAFSEKEDNYVDGIVMAQILHIHAPQQIITSSKSAQLCLCVFAQSA